MTTKAEFNAEEWEKISEAPALGGLLVISSQRGGTIRETFAMAKTYGEARQDQAETELVGEIAESAPKVDPRQFSSKDDLRLRGPEKITEAVKLVEAKATPEELEAYRNFVMTVARRVAEADKSGGFLGIGGERVTGNEESAINDVATAVGAA